MHFCRFRGVNGISILVAHPRCVGHALTDVSERVVGADMHNCGAFHSSGECLRGRISGMSLVVKDFVWGDPDCVPYLRRKSACGSSPWRWVVQTLLQCDYFGNRVDGPSALSATDATVSACLDTDHNAVSPGFLSDRQNLYTPLSKIQ